MALVEGVGGKVRPGWMRQWADQKWRMTVTFERKEPVGPLQKFSEGVATEVFGAIDVDKLIKVIEAIAAIVSQMIANCPKSSRIAKAAASPSFGERVFVRRQVASACEGCRSIPRDQRWNVADAILARAAAMPEADVAAVVDDVFSTDVM